MSFDLREHTADVAVEATAGTLAETFAAVAEGLTAAHCDAVPEDIGERFELTVTAESRAALLFDYLDELIYERDVRSVLPVGHDVAISGASDDEWTVVATARGVPFEAVDAREIKAVTYSEMVLAETPTGWRAYVVFDV